MRDAVDGAGMVAANQPAGVAEAAPDTETYDAWDGGEVDKLCRPPCPWYAAARAALLHLTRSDALRAVAAAAFSASSVRWRLSARSSGELRYICRKGFSSGMWNMRLGWAEERSGTRFRRSLSLKAVRAAARADSLECGAEGGAVRGGEG